MTHIRIRASLGGNIPRMSKTLPFRVTQQTVLRYVEVTTQLFVFFSK
jgi:hypothetical protein